MNHELLKRIIFDQHEIIRNAQIMPRRYELDPQANYVITGLRRAGKSTLLYDVARTLVRDGVAWERIVYINFEDERLADFSANDFQDIQLVQSELSNERGFYFFDEIQGIAHWEKFARRLADAGERVYITGSNATMLGRQIASTLGSRYFTLHITPYRFDEYLDANGQKHTGSALYSTREIGRISSYFDTFYQQGGFPESLRFSSPRTYVENVYSKVLLGDIAARYNVRNVDVLRILMKKVAETVRSEVSFTTLYNALKSIGHRVSKDTVIAYLGYAHEAYLLFSITNATAKFVEREGSPKYYFSDNGLLNLFLFNRETALLENEIAVALFDRFGAGLHYIKSPKTGIDVDFYVPEAELAVQVAYSIAGEAHEREIGNLVKLSQVDNAVNRLIVVTKEEDGIIERGGVRIEIMPAWKLLLTVTA